MRVEYELDQWEWQGTTQSIEIDPEDYRGMAADQTGSSIYRDIHNDAVGKMHLVYQEDEVVQEILAALEADDDDE